MSLYLSKKVMRNDSLRRAFNTLAVKTFGLSFEDWYQKGYWSEFNTPYTIFDGDRAVANVSVNQLKILCQGKVYNGIQLGTVMTDEAYRNQGLSRHIMEQVKEDWEKRYDFIFLFANESVLDFYPKFGFERKEQYQFETKAVPSPGLCRKLNMDSLHDRQMLAHYYKKTNPFSEIQVIDNYGLLMFYCCSFMKDWVYYSPEYDAVVIAEQDHNSFRCYDVYCDKRDERNDLPGLLSSMAKAGTKRIELEFTPYDVGCFDRSLRGGDADSLFVLSEGRETILDGGKRLFPSISHT